MNTKTMRLPPRRVLTSDKRVISGATAISGKLTETTLTNLSPPLVKSLLEKTPTEPAGSSQLLAGYLAHEFLDKGTLFGEQWNPAGAQADPFPAQFIEPKKTKPRHYIEPSDHKRRRYVEVANILRVDGAHLPGIVNPSLLARSFKL